jgi:hypothetical protein
VSTLEEGWTDPPSKTTDQTPADLAGLYAEHPVHVKVVDTASERVAPEFTGMATWVVQQAGSGNPTQLLQRNYHRYKAKMVWTIPASTTVWLDNKPDSLSNPVPPATKASFTGPLASWVMPEYDGQQSLYAVFTGTGPVTVTVIDESYGTVQ